mgnify:CR=1 FL=1
MTSAPGYVYILTNESFRQDWIKIGKSSRPVDVRSKELDNTAVPLPFAGYATIRKLAKQYQTQVDTKFNEVEKMVHKMIDRLTDLRIRQNREFFNVPPEVALDIFRDVASTLADAVITVYRDGKPLPDSLDTEQPPKSVPKKARRGRFKFSLAGIKIGEFVTFKPTGLKVRVASDDTVEYEGRIYKLSPFVGTYLPADRRTPSDTYCGPDWFTHNGVTLSKLRLIAENGD